MFGLEAGRALDRLVLVDPADDDVRLPLVVAELAQGLGHGLVDDLQEAAADQLLVLDEGDVRLHAGGVAIHHEGDRAGGGEHGDLAVAQAVLVAEEDHLVPRALGGLQEVHGHVGGIDLLDRVAVLAHHPQHRLMVLLEFLERPGGLGDARRLGIGGAGHQGGDRRRVVASRVGVVGQAARHQQGAEVGVADPQRPELVRILLDPLRRIAGVADDHLHAGDHHLAGVLEALDVEPLVGVEEAHQVERRQVAGGVVEEHVLAARVAGVDAVGGSAGVPVVDGGVVLHARIAAHPGGLGDLLHQLAGLVGAHRLAGDAGPGLPLAAGEDGLHEPVGHPHGVVGVLVGDGVVGAALDVEAPLVAGVDERPGLALLLLLAADEVLDVRVVDVEDHHLGRPAGLAAALDDAGEGVEALHEGDRARGGAAAGQRLAGGAQLREIAAGAGAVLEQHALGLRQGEDGVHGVLGRVDEAGRALGLLLDADVEPDRRVEAGVLVEEDVLELGVEGLGVLLGGEVAVRPAPGGDGVRHPADELADAALAVGGVELPPEVLGDHHVGRRLRPEFGHLDVLLLEDLLPLLVRDHGIAQLPLDGVEGVHPGRRVVTLEAQTPRRDRLGNHLLPGSAHAGLQGPGPDRCSVASHLVGMQGGMGLHALSPRSCCAR